MEFIKKKSLREKRENENLPAILEQTITDLELEILELKIQLESGDE